MGRCGMSHYGSLFAASTWVPSTFIAQTSGRYSALSQLYLSVAPPFCRQSASPLAEPPPALARATTLLGVLLIDLLSGPVSSATLGPLKVFI